MTDPEQSDEPRDEVEAELLRSKASSRSLLLAVLAGALATLILVAAAWYAQHRARPDADVPSERRSEPRGGAQPTDQPPSTVRTAPLK